MIVIEDPQLSLFWNGFWYTRDGRANIETMLTGSLKLILTSRAWKIAENPATNNLIYILAKIMPLQFYDL